jgi:hypothetical protein
MVQNNHPMFDSRMLYELFSKKTNLFFFCNILDQNQDFGHFYLK